MAKVLCAVMVLAAAAAAGCGVEAAATAAGCGVEAAATAAEAAHAVLQAHGLPLGLLPTGIASFRHDAETGRFEVALESACTAHFEVSVRYNSTVAGEISYGRIGALSGVSAQDLFLWFNVRSICVDVPSSGVIYFDVGVVFKHFPIAGFQAPAPCTPDSLLLLLPLQQRRDDGSVNGISALQ